MGFHGKQNKHEAHLMAPYTSPAIHLNQANIHYVLWGYHALYLCFRAHFIAFGDLHIVVADSDLERATTTFEENDYSLCNSSEIGFTRLSAPYRFSHKIPFPEFRVLDSSKPPPNFAKKEREMGFIDWTPRIVLMPASSMYFNIDNPQYVKKLWVNPIEYRCDEDDWVQDPDFPEGWWISQPTLPGMLDSAWSLVHHNPLRGNHWPSGIGSFEGKELEKWQALTDSDKRRYALRHYGFVIQDTLDLYSYRQRELGLYPTLEDIPVNVKRVAERLSKEHRDGYLKRWISDDPKSLRDNLYTEEELEALEESEYEDDETWDSIYGVED